MQIDLFHLIEYPSSTNSKIHPIQMLLRHIFLENTFSQIIG